MKKSCLILVIIFFAVAGSCFAADSAPDPDDSYCRQVAEQAPTELKRGCCSWHGGVCGCKNGRTVCCDGSYSPSCRCD